MFATFLGCNIMRKIVINKCYGMFGLSDVAMTRYKQESGNNIDYDMDIPRDDRTLVTIVTELGEDSFADYAELAVVSIPYNVEWQIRDYDGIEHIEEKHRTWR